MSLKEKRKTYSDMEKGNTVYKKRQRPRLKLEDAPPVSNIRELITISKNAKFYRNLDTVMLWNITPFLEELNSMIGMDSLKETIFFQIIYYLQGMHTRNKNEEYLHTIIMGPPGHGKCLGYNTPVLLYSGKIERVQNIKQGDFLMGDDSTPRKVISTTTGKEKLFRIKQSYGDDFIVNKSHILSLKLTKNPDIFFNEDGYLVRWFDKNSKKENKFIYDTRLMDKGYKQCLDFIKTLPKQGYTIDLSVDEYLTRSDEWKNVFKGYKVPIHFNETIYNSYKIGLDLSDLTKNFDSDKFESLIKSGYKVTSIKTRLSILAAIIDSIGELNNNNYYIELYNDLIKEEICYLANSVGIRIDRQNNMLKLYGNIKDIPSKYAEHIPTTSIDLLTCDIILEELQEGDYYGFEIDGNKRFLLGDFTVTHNTEVSKIIGKIYQALGILSPNGKFKVAHREDFVGEYLGQTAMKTKNLLKSCLGGVLFIDEVYALAPRQNDRDSFAKEAIDTLTSFLSEHKNDFCCIAAGYEDDIKNYFFAMNQGLDRRFPWVHKIEDYSPKALAEIFIKMLNDMNWKTDLTLSNVETIISSNKELFKNGGGDIETFLSKCKMMHSKRVFCLDKDKKFILTKEDLTFAIKYISEHTKDPVNQPPPHMYT